MKVAIAKRKAGKSQRTPVDGKHDGTGGSAQPQSQADLRSEAVTQEREVASAVKFPVVGVGASASGLEAFNNLLKALPPKPGMAFVLIPHLDPARESAMADLRSEEH